MVLRTSLLKRLFYVAIALGFTVIGFLMIASGAGWRGWFVGGFFTLALVILGIQSLPGAAYLELHPEGFVVCTMFRRQPLVRWDRVSAFRVVRVPPANRKMVAYDGDVSRAPRLAQVSEALVGANSGLPDTFGLSAERLVELLNTWRSRVVLD